jgi:hypothetical protein
MKFYFHPNNEKVFKEAAVGKFVRTLVYNEESNEIISFTRKVKILWQQTCKNNIESDHRIKDLSGSHFQIYSWIVQSEDELSLPSFQIKE